MKAKYIGVAESDEDAPRRVEFAGKVFRRGQFVDVTGIASGLQGKLRANPGFVVSDDPLTEEEAAAASEDTQVVASAPTGKASKKGDIIAALEALADKHPGKVEFDPKAKAEVLAARLEELQFELGE